MSEGRPKAVYKAGDKAGPGGVYLVVRLLGAGGMGEVYEVERDGARYAYKTLQFRHRHNGHVLSRFQAEAAAGQEMLHPNIARVFESGLDQHGGYLVMELLRGQSLHEALYPKRLTTERILEIGIEIADALHALHLAKIVHRDVKPGNIFLTDDGRALLLDLGAAKFERYGMNTTQSQGTIGTVLFMSPEHINPDAVGVKNIDGRSDVYSLGHVLFYVLSGEFAVLLGREEGSPTQISLWHILSDAPSLKVAAPHLPDPLVKVIDKAMRRDRNQRFTSAAELATNLRAVLSWLREERAAERTWARVAPVESVIDQTVLPFRVKKTPDEARESPPERERAAKKVEGPGRGRSPSPAGVGPRGTVRMGSAPEELSPSPRRAVPVKGGTTPMDVAPAGGPPSAIVRAAAAAVDELPSEEKRRIFEDELALLRQAAPKGRRGTSPPSRKPRPRQAWMGPLVAVAVALALAGALLVGVTQLWGTP